MRGHQWSSAEGTIVDVDSRRHEHTYAIEAINNRSVHVRGTVRHKSPTAYTVGSKVRIEIDEHNQMRFDPNAPDGDPLISTMTMSDQIAEAAAAFDQPWASRGPDFGTPRGGRGTAGDFSGLAGGLAGLAGALGGTNAHVIGPDGRQVRVDPTEVAQLTQAMLSGDPAAKQAAVQRLHQIKAAAKPQASAEQRLAALDQLLNKGMVTQAEYETQRQRIIDSI